MSVNESLPDRMRVVLLGQSGVGKTAILDQFLYNNFKDKHKPTVDDLHSKTFMIQNSKLKVDFLDTSGDDEFPAMRRLSIKSGHGFILVYSVTSQLSLEVVKTRLREIENIRENCQELPIVVVGNKSELLTSREVDVDQVKDWIQAEFNTFQISVIECSALKKENITTIFRNLLELSKLKQIMDSFNESCSIERRASAYGRICSLQMKQNKNEDSRKTCLLERERKERNSSSLDISEPRLKSSIPPLSPSFWSILSPKCSRSPKSKSPSPKSSTSTSPSPRSPFTKSSQGSTAPLIFDFNINNIPNISRECEAQETEGPKSIMFDINPIQAPKKKSRSKSLNRERKKHKNSNTNIQECVIS